MNPTLARLRRILVMVPWLLEHPGADVEEVARRFDVRPAEVLDDLDVLGYCGLPGYGGGDLIEASVSGGQVVVRMAEFFARPLALSVREGLSLLLAARATRDSGILGDSLGGGGAGRANGDDPLDSAIAKLEAHLGAEAAVPVAVDIEAGGADHLGSLWPAVTEGRVVRLTYRSASKNETTVRDVEPWTIRSLGGSWYLQGFCRLAQDGRSFRLDRIRDLVVTDEVASGPPPDDISPPVYRPGPDDPLVVVEVSPDAAWVSDQVVLSDRQRGQDGWLRLQFQAATLDWAARLVLRLGAQARVAEPAELAALVRARAQDVLALYDTEGPL